MNCGRRTRFILQVVFLIVFLPIAALIGKGILDLAASRAAEIERTMAMTRMVR